MLQQMPTYTYPRPSVATDVVTLRVHEGRIEVLLIERAETPKGWALPGGFLRVGGPRIELAAAKGATHPKVDASLEACARRELKEEAGVDPRKLHQFGAYGNADRDPRGRYVSVAYWTFVHNERCRPKAGSDARSFQWQPIDKAKGLAFDHDDIVKDAHRHIRRRRYEIDLFLDLMPAVFTYPMFKDAYALFWEGERKVDRSNLHRKVASEWAAAETDTPLASPGPKAAGAPAKRYDLEQVRRLMGAKP